jgi:hypothetical protein
MKHSLQDFIAHARKKGMDHGTIRTLLLSAGWKEKDVAKALIEGELDMPVPLPPDSGGAREAFYHLLTFTSLYASFISLIILFFTYINRLFPDPAFSSYADPDSDRSAIRWSMSAIIIAFPLFLWFSRMLTKEMRAHPERSVSGVRRWLTYLTLFLAAGTLIGDLVTLVFYLLEGELTIRFLLKVGILFLLSGSVLGYYLAALRLPPDHKSMPLLHRSAALGSLAVVLIALVWGATIIGSPFQERLRKFDEQRVSNLQSIASEIQQIAYGNRFRGNGEEPENPVPPTLEAVQQQAQYQAVDIRDPETGEMYTYNVIDDTRYKLCATFTFPRDNRYNVRWNHPAGEHCYEIDVEEDTY